MSEKPSGKPKHHEELLHQFVDLGVFRIDPLGRIWRVARRSNSGDGSLLQCKPHRAERIAHGGYYQVNTRIDGIIVSAAAHRLVWFHFNGHIDGDLTVNHKDGVKSNAHPDNLELATNQQQTKHALETLGRRFGQLGENHHSAKLTTSQVLDIRKRSTNGVSNVDIANILGLKRQCVYQVTSGRNWRHL